VLSSDEESDDDSDEAPVDLDDLEASSEDKDVDSDDSDFVEEENDTEPSKPKARAKKPPIPESPLKVLMDAKDIPAAPGKRDSPEEEGQSDNRNSNGMEEVSTLVDGTGRRKADQEVKERVLKLLNTGFHDQSNENEAKNAMKLAQKLMRKHNLSQALLLKERQERHKHGTNDDSSEILKGGVVKVRIIYRKTGKPSLFARWISNLMNPVAENFDVKSFYSCRKGIRCSVTFYGIYTNAQLAGYAFKVAIERISQMMTQYRPEKNPWNQGITTQSSRLSYALGIVEGIQEEVDRTAEAEKQRRQRKLERAKLAVAKGEAYEESDDEEEEETDNIIRTGFAAKGGQSDDNGDDGAASDDKEGPGFVAPASDSYESKSKPSDAMSGDDLNSRIQELETERQSAIVLINHQEKIADQVLKDQGIKIFKQRKRKSICFDRGSFDQGIEDSREIDINQRAIRDGVKFKREKKPKKESR
jgi:hypothetical protein